MVNRHPASVGPGRTIAFLRHRSGSDDHGPEQDVRAFLQAKSRPKAPGLGMAMVYDYKTADVFPWSTASRGGNHGSI